MDERDERDSDEDEDDETAEDFDAFKKWLNDSVSEDSPGTASIVHGKFVVATPPAQPTSSPAASSGGACQLCGKGPGVCSSFGNHPKIS